MTEGALMDAAEIAVRLGMAKSSIYALCASGAIPAYKCGKKLRGRRFDLAEVKAALRVSVQPDTDKKGVKRGRVLEVDRLAEYDGTEESVGGVTKRMTDATETAKLLNSQAGHGVSDGFRTRDLRIHNPAL